MEPLLLDPELRARRGAALRDLGRALVYLTKAGGVPEKVYALSGELYLSSSGWLLLRVPNGLGRAVFSALDENGLELPLNEAGQYNAHISVADPSEVEKMGGPNAISERGKHYHYTLGPVKTVVPTNWDGVSKVYYVQCFSPEIEEFRKSFGLEPRRKGYDLHLTVAIRRVGVLRNNEISKAAGEPDDTLTRYECPHCQGWAYNGPPKEPGTRFRGSAVCVDCGEGFAAIATGKALKRDVPRPECVAKRDRDKSAAHFYHCVSCGRSFKGANGFCNQCQNKTWPCARIMPSESKQANDWEAPLKDRPTDKDLIQKIVDGYTAEQLDGIYVYYYGDPGTSLCIVDIMDWGEESTGKKIGDAVSKIIGSDHVIYHNEQPKPKGQGWSTIRPTEAEKKADVLSAFQELFPGFLQQVKASASCQNGSKGQAETAPYYSDHKSPADMIKALKVSEKLDKVYLSADRFSAHPETEPMKPRTRAYS